MRMRGWVTLAAVLTLGPGLARAVDPAPATVAFFEKQVRPLLVERCHKCHSVKAKKSSGGLALDSREAILTGGDNGPAVVPGKPEKSRLVAAIHWATPDLRMPPKAKLQPAQIAVLEKWVRDGAVYPDGAQAAAIDPRSSEARQFWSFQPLRKVPLPVVQNAKWPRKPIDYFLLAAMEQRKLTPSAPADRRALIRRASFDLTGLPPSPDEVDAFI